MQGVCRSVDLLLVGLGQGFVRKERLGGLKGRFHGAEALFGVIRGLERLDCRIDLALRDVLAVEGLLGFIQRFFKGVPRIVRVAVVGSVLQLVIVAFVLVLLRCRPFYVRWAAFAGGCGQRVLVKAYAQKLRGDLLEQRT